MTPYRDTGAALLARLVEEESFRPRVHAAEALARLDGYREAGAELLARLAEEADAATGGYQRVNAAGTLARLDGYREAGAELLIHLAQDTTLDARNRVDAARSLGWVDGYQREAVRHLHRLENAVDHEYAPYVRFYANQIEGRGKEAAGDRGGS